MDATTILPIAGIRRHWYASLAVIAMSVLAVAALAVLLVSVTVGHTPDDGPGPPITMPSDRPVVGVSHDSGQGGGRPEELRTSTSASPSCSGRSSCGQGTTTPTIGAGPAPSSASLTSGATASTAAPTVSATYETVSAASNSFRGRLTITNRTSGALPWQVVLDFPAGVQVTSVTTGSATTSGQRATFTGTALTAAQVLTVEFNASRAYLAAYAPTACTVNGTACA